MAQTATLVQIPTLVSPVTRVQNVAFCNDYYIVSPPNASEVDRKLIRIQGLIQELFVVRGIDYRNNTAQLMTDATAFTGGITMFHLDAAEAAIEWSNGSRSNASIANNIPALRQVSPDLLQRPAETLDRMIALLRLRLLQ